MEAVMGRRKTLAPEFSAEEAEFIAALRQQEETHSTRAEAEHKAALPAVPPEVAQRVTLPEAHHDTLKRTRDAAELEAQQGRLKRAATAMAEELPAPMEVEAKAAADDNAVVAMDTENGAAASAAAGPVDYEAEIEEEYIAAGGKRRRRWDPFADVGPEGLNNAPPGTLVLPQERDAVLDAAYWEVRLRYQREVSQLVRQSLDRYGNPTLYRKKSTNGITTSRPHELAQSQ
jgi:hypothetical protein